MSVILSPLAGAGGQFLNNSGIILSGGKLYTYAAGTTVLQTSYTSSDGLTAHTNPIILDSSGRVPGGEIWLTSTLAYKVVVKDSTNVVIATYDNLSGASASFVPMTGFAGQTGVVQALAGDSGAAWVGFQPDGGDARSVQSKLRDTVSVKDFGAVGDGVTDDTVAIQLFLNYVSSGHYSGIIPPGDYLVSSTLTVTSASTISNFEVIAQGFSGGWQANGAFGVRFLWNGAASTVFYFNNCRDAIFSLGMILPKPGKTVSVAVDIDGANSTNIHLTVCAAPGSGTLTTGIRVANTSTTGNDLHTFDDCQIYGATVGFDVRGSQSKFHRLNRCTFSSCTTGINQVAGSFALVEPNFSANGVDIALTSVEDSISVYAPQSELSGRFLYAPNQYSAGEPFNIYGGRLSTDSAHLNADGNYIVYNHGGPLNLHGVDCASGRYVSAWRVKAFNNSFYLNSSTVSAIGCQFPNPTVWESTTAIAAPRVVLSCRNVNSDSTQSPLPFVLDGTQYSTKAAIIYAPSVTTLAANATTLDVSTGSDFLTSANSGATALATISNGRVGQIITIAGGSSTNATTIADAGVFKLNAAITLNANTTITLKTYDGTNWLEMCRSVN